MYNNNHKYVDRKIYEDMRLYVDCYVKHRTRRRFVLFKLLISFVIESKRFTLNNNYVRKLEVETKSRNLSLHKREISCANASTKETQEY